MVSIRTVWKNSCARDGGTSLEVQHHDAVVVPYDIVAEGRVCLQAPQQFTHTAIIRFDAPGLARVLIKGRKETGGAVVTVERRIVVR